MKTLLKFLIITVFFVGCMNNSENNEAQPALKVLESAISEVGYFRWWTKNESGLFQVEFGGVLLYNQPVDKSTSPSSILALCFEDTRCVATLCRHTGMPEMPEDWFSLLSEDKLEPPTIICEEFTITNVKDLRSIVSQSEEIRFIIGNNEDLDDVKEKDAFVAFWAGDVGLVIVANSMSPLAINGEITPQQIIEKNEQWWKYWKEYWKRKETNNPMPKDYACEATIPLSN